MKVLLLMLSAVVAASRPEEYLASPRYSIFDSGCQLFNVMQLVYREVADMKLALILCDFSKNNDHDCIDRFTNTCQDILDKLDLSISRKGWIIIRGSIENCEEKMKSGINMSRLRLFYYNNRCPCSSEMNTAGIKQWNFYTLYHCVANNISPAELKNLSDCVNNIPSE